MEYTEISNNEEFGASENTLVSDGVSTSLSHSSTENINKFIKGERDCDNENIIYDNDCGKNDTIHIKRIKSTISRTSTKMSLPPAERRKSYQVRAMTRKTLSYQRRQIKTNICCVA